MRNTFLHHNSITKMKKDEYEIIERSSGFWIVDGIGYVNGPYSTVEEASQDVPQGQLQYPLTLEDTNG